MNSRADRLHAALVAAMPDAIVRVRDDSASHAGHAGAQPGGQTHFGVEIVWPGFAGMSRVARSRRVHDLVAAEFAEGLHALQLRLRTPVEAGETVS